MAVTTNIKIRGEWDETGSGDLFTPRAQHTIEHLIALASGTSASQADLVWSDTRTLAATSENLDLAGSLSGALGTTVTFAKVSGIIIRNNTATAAAKLLVGGAASNQFINWVANSSDILQIGPSGILFLTSPVDGYAVTAATGDILKIDSGAATISYSIVIWGRSV